MVRAIIEGRKSQTRRAVKNAVVITCDDLRGVTDSPCPYGAPGDTLWVRERWGVANACIDDGDSWVSVGYAETVGNYYHDVNWRLESRRPPDEAARYYEQFVEEASKANGGEMPEGDGLKVFRWRSPIYMPMWASRLTLRVVAVHIERLQAIREADAIAEGVETHAQRYGIPEETLYGTTPWHRYDGEPCCAVSAVESYRTLWESIRGSDSWEVNPWVWVISFDRADRGDNQ